MRTKQRTRHDERHESSFFTLRLGVRGPRTITFSFQFRYFSTTLLAEAHYPSAARTPWREFGARRVILGAVPSISLVCVEADR